MFLQNLLPFIDCVSRDLDGRVCWRGSGEDFHPCKWGQQHTWWVKGGEEGAGDRGSLKDGEKGQFQKAWNTIKRTWLVTVET